MKRRIFIKTGIAGVGVFTMSGLVLTSHRAFAAAIRIDLIAESATKSLVGGATTTVWQFRDATTATAKGPGALASGFQVVSGDVITVNLTNNLTRPVGFVIPGLSVEPGTQVAPGATQTFTVTAGDPGSYFFTDHATDLLGRAMGLAGPLIVMPADGSQRLAPAAPVFNNQYTLFLNELDTRLNTAVANGGSGDAELANFEPNYYFANGLSYPATTSDPETAIALTVGQQTAIRFVNGGLQMNSMHFHGYHVDVTLRDRAAETVIVEKDTVAVRVGECVDVMLNVTQPGAYELHNHYLPAVTGNGVYPNGAMIMMTAV